MTLVMSVGAVDAIAVSTQTGPEMGHQHHHHVLHPQYLSHSSRETTPGVRDRALGLRQLALARSPTR